MLVEISCISITQLSEKRRENNAIQTQMVGGSSRWSLDLSFRPGCDYRGAGAALDGSLVSALGESDISGHLELHHSPHRANPALWSANWPLSPSAHLPGRGAWVWSGEHHVWSGNKLPAAHTGSCDPGELWRVDWDARTGIGCCHRRAS